MNDTRDRVRPTKLEMKKAETYGDSHFKIARYASLICKEVTNIHYVLNVFFGASLIGSVARLLSGQVLPCRQIAVVTGKTLWSGGYLSRESMEVKESWFWLQRARGSGRGRWYRSTVGALLVRLWLCGSIVGFLFSNNDDEPPFQKQAQAIAGTSPSRYLSGSSYRHRCWTG